MSAGNLVVVKYEMSLPSGATSGNRCRIYVQPETLTAVFSGGVNAGGTQGGGAAAQYTFVMPIARSVNSRTLRARCIRVRWITPPVGYSADTQPLITVPRTPVFLNTSVGSQGQYLGGLFEVVSKHSWGI